MSSTSAAGCAVANGVPGCALIDEVLIATGRHGRRYIGCLKYRFLVEDEGGPELRDVKLRWNMPYGPDEVRRGDMVLVLYDPANPARQTLDCFDARPEDRLRLCAGDVSASASTLYFINWHPLGCCLCFLMLSSSGRVMRGVFTCKACSGTRPTRGSSSWSSGA